MADNIRKRARVWHSRDSNHEIQRSMPPTFSINNLKIINYHSLFEFLTLQLSEYFIKMAKPKINCGV